MLAWPEHKESTGTKTPVLYFLDLFCQTLISTSTPLGNSSFISASIVFEDDE